MPISFSTNELINIAIGIEKQGIAYYDVMATSTWHEVARDLFKHLAKMERAHIEVFQSMLSEVDKHESPKHVKEEYDAYMHGLINSAVFTDEMAANELATHIDNEDEALDIAIGAEKDSILFYYNLKESLAPTVEPIIMKVLSEEKLHLSQLSELKRILLNLK